MDMIKNIVSSIISVACNPKPHAKTGAIILLYCSIVGLITHFFDMDAYDALTDRYPLQADAYEDFVHRLTKLFTRRRRRKSTELYFPVELPREVMSEIGKRLPSQLDILWFRSVCKEWRSSLPCPTRFPLLVPPPPDCDPNSPYFITQVTIYITRGRTMRQLVEFEEMSNNGHGKFRGKYFLSSEKCDKPMTWDIDPEQSEISFNCKGHRLRKGGGEYSVNKMVLISSSAEGVNLSYARLSDMSVFALLSSPAMEGRLAVLRLQGPSKNWYWDTNFCTKVFKAICSYRGGLCAVDSFGQVLMVDYHSLHMTPLGPSLPILPYIPIRRYPLCTPTLRMPQKELFECGGLLHFMDFEQMYVYRTLVGYTLSLDHHTWIPFVESRDVRGYSFAYIV